MKLALLAGISALALAASDPVASAAPIMFGFTGSIVDFTVPTTGTYDIVAAGAQGGSDSTGDLGGNGAIIGGDVMLTAGTVLEIAAGGMGGSVSPSIGGGAGGGGGSFVVGPSNSPLVIAGGGGGGGFAGGGLTGGDGGNGNSDGQPGDIPGSGGSGGSGGGAGSLEMVGLPPLPGGAGGGGFIGNGADASPDVTGGQSFLNGAAGGSGQAGANGGFGGGGGGDGEGGGGGGGYSGGGGGANAGGGGGGSFDTGTNQVLTPDANAGNGFVTIGLVSTAIPEPASLALLGVGVVGVGLVRRRRS